MPQNTKDACYFDVKRRILSVDIHPGSDLDEVSLTRVYGISRTPLREVFQRLSGEGYVELTANRGAKVSALNIPDMRTFFQTAPAIYTNVSRLAAEHRTDRELYALGEALEQLRRATAKRKPTAAILADHRFHALIGQMARNPYLMVCHQRLLIDHTRLSQTARQLYGSHALEGMSKAATQHDALLTAIRSRNGDTAANIARQNWALSKAALETLRRPETIEIELLDQALSA